MGEIGQNPLRVVGYVRVSTGKQAEHGVSLEAQIARVKAYAELHHLVLVDVVVGAGESGKSLDRPGLKRALELLRGADALLIPTLDRLTRSVRDWGTLQEVHFSDRKLLSVGEHVDVETASGRFILNILFSKAQFEREQTAERTAETTQHKAGKGEYTGGAVPYGYRVVAAATEADSARLELEPTEQAVIAAARHLRATTTLSLRAIGAELMRLGHRPRGSDTFAPNQVKRMLESAAAAERAAKRRRVDLTQAGECAAPSGATPIRQSAVESAASQPHAQAEAHPRGPPGGHPRAHGRG